MKRQPERMIMHPDDRPQKRVVVTVSPPTKDEKERYCHVDPSVVYVRYGGTVTFRTAPGCGPLEVFVPTPNWAPDLFPRSGRLFTVPATRTGKTVTVVVAKTEPPRRIVYPYAVYCRECNCFGRGSMPKMIIGP